MHAAPACCLMVAATTAHACARLHECLRPPDSLPLCLPVLPRPHLPPHPLPQNMQAAYHYVSGIPLLEVGTCVNTAKAGEICLTGRVRDALGNTATVCPTSKEGVYLLQGITEACADLSRYEVSKRQEKRQDKRHKKKKNLMGRLFVPPAILRNFHNHNDLSQVWGRLEHRR